MKFLSLLLILPLLLIGVGTTSVHAEDDPCNYHGENVCDSSGICDDDHFDCVSDCADPSAGDTTGKCPGDDTGDEDTGGHKSSDNNNDNDNDKSSDNDNNGKDRSETNPKHNDPCNYYGRDVCDKDRKGCDNHHFDCLTDLDNGDYCTTGMCPGDDRPYKNKKNDDSNENHKNNGNNNHKTVIVHKKTIVNKNNNIAATNTTPKFRVDVVLDKITKAEALQFQMRVIVYGPHVLNKPTLDKPGQVVNIGGCVTSCYTTWEFTAWKVPLGSKISACVWNPNTGHQSCGYGLSHSQYGPETIHVSVPSSSNSDSQTTTSKLSNTGTNENN
jgi:hypothetical protein